MVAVAASMTWGGVPKSGSPTAKEITSSIPMIRLKMTRMSDSGVLLAAELIGFIGVVLALLRAAARPRQSEVILPDRGYARVTAAG
jgi:hypothetical protein